MAIANAQPYHMQQCSPLARLDLDRPPRPASPPAPAHHRSMGISIAKSPSRAAVHRRARQARLAGGQAVRGRAVCGQGVVLLYYPSAWPMQYTFGQSEKQSMILHDPMPADASARPSLGQPWHPPFYALTPPSLRTATVRMISPSKLTNSLVSVWWTADSAGADERAELGRRPAVAENGRCGESEVKDRPAILARTESDSWSLVLSIAPAPEVMYRPLPSSQRGEVPHVDLIQRVVAHHHQPVVRGDGGQRCSEPVELRVAVLREDVLVEAALGRIVNRAAARILGGARVPLGRVWRAVLAHAGRGVQKEKRHVSRPATEGQTLRVVARWQHPPLRASRELDLRSDIPSILVVPERRVPRDV
eukprot:scaffold4437_cov115-Isochrysis_galbana.AAC.4